MDLEPEGKVYISISLTGSFIDGKAKNAYWELPFMHNYNIFVALQDI